MSWMPAIRRAREGLETFGLLAVPARAWPSPGSAPRRCIYARTGGSGSTPNLGPNLALARDPLSQANAVEDLANLFIRE
eukprot:8480417-Pyramimonas_sp.AAC.1